jgi:hypothetical protein
MTKTKKPLRKRRLRTLHDCIRAGSFLWNAVACDEIAPEKAGKLTYLLNVQKSICLAIENLEIEKQQLNIFNERLRKIEEKLGIAHR